MKNCSATGTFLNPILLRVLRMQIKERDWVVKLSFYGWMDCYDE
jgi:hypothetical protein